MKGWEGLYLSGSGQKQLTASCEHGNEPVGFRKCGESVSYFTGDQYYENNYNRAHNSHFKLICPINCSKKAPVRNNKHNTTKHNTTPGTYGHNSRDPRQSRDFQEPTCQQVKPWDLDDYEHCGQMPHISQLDIHLDHTQWHSLFAWRSKTHFILIRWS